jgi:hypothetical protein
MPVAYRPCLNQETGAPWSNHGQYVRCVAHAVNELRAAGLLTEEEGDHLVSTAAKSKIGKPGFVSPECQ